MVIGNLLTKIKVPQACLPCLQLFETLPNETYINHWVIGYGYELLNSPISHTYNATQRTHLLEAAELSVNWVIMCICY